MMRTYEVGRYPDVLSIDSGWNDNEVTIDVKTARGKTITLTVAEWHLLVFNVENIITHCEQQRQKQRREKLKR